MTKALVVVERNTVRWEACSRETSRAFPRKAPSQSFKRAARIFPVSPRLLFPPVPHMTMPSALRRALLSLLCPLPALAVPVAVNDTYTTLEDTAFVPVGPPVVNSSFEAGADGWAYLDDPFASPYNTSAPTYATGSVNTTRGVGATGCLLVDIGRRPPAPRSCSGAYSRTITLAAPATVEVSISYHLRAVGTVFSNLVSCYADAVFTVDGTRYGNGTNSAVARLVVPGAEGD